MAAATDRPGSRRGRWALIALFAAGLAMHGAIAEWRSTHAVLINASESLPHWAFLLSTGKAPARGDIVFFEAPRHPLVVAHFGAAPPPFAKRVLGTAGDRVAHRDGNVLINGVAAGRMKPRTRQGELLTPGATGVVPAGCLYAGTDHPDGFDSRYAEIGFVCGKQILGVGTAIL